MRSPAKMLTIQIDITNLCNKSCSNCTRFCGNYKEPFFMDFETFKRAVDSLDGFGGSYGIMGGEPTLHPEFERFVHYIASKFEPLPSMKKLIYPQKDFIKMQHSLELENRSIMEVDGETLYRSNGPGLFSNMGKSYKKYYELICDSFYVQCLNDHVTPNFHQPGLFARKDLGIPDDEWFQLRDNCWIQNEWSATITPKGAFFCEVAGALDMLFDGPGGWSIEPDWWKRKPEDFAGQLHWCELCGFALDTFTRNSDESIDDVSPTLYEMLKKVNSPKLGSGRINAVKIDSGIISENSKKEENRLSAGMPYIVKYEDRFSALHSILFAYEYDFANIPDGDDFGFELNKLLSSTEEWVVFHSANVRMIDDFSGQMSKYVLNPGTMHYLDLSESNDTRFIANADTENSGYAALFSKNAMSLREFGFDRIAHTKSFAEIIAMWQQHKIIELSSKIDDFDKKPELYTGVKFAVWGAGVSGTAVLDSIQSMGGDVVLVVDKDMSKLGHDFYGLAIGSPEHLLTEGATFDYLITANYSRFREIRDEAVSMGVDEKKIITINNLLGGIPTSLP